MRKVLYFFSEIMDQDIDWLAGAGAKQSLRKGEVLVSQGRPIEALSLILVGKFSVTVGSTAVAQLGSGEIVGELSFLDARPPSASVTAMDDSVVLSIPSARLRSKLRSDTGFASRFYLSIGISLAHRLRETTSQFGYGKQARVDEESPDDMDPDFLDKVSLAAARFDQTLQRLLKS